MVKKKLFECKTPCGNCPYRKDAPLAHWHIEEFQKVLDAEKSQCGSVFLCHKQNGSICVGFLINQIERNLPSIALRLALSNHGVDRHYLDSISCKSEMFESVEEMCAANFPEIKLWQ